MVGNIINKKKSCQWLVNIRISRIIFLLVIVILTLSLLIHLCLPTMDRSSVHITHGAHSHLDLPEDLHSISSADLQTRIEELLRIKGSVSSELRDMENKRQKLQADIQFYTKTIEQFKIEASHQETELTRLKVSVEQAQVAQREAVQQNTPDLALPKRLTADELPSVMPPPTAAHARNCRLFSCFDHSRCSITSGFPVYLYDPDEFPVMQDGWDVDGFLKTTLKQALGYNPHLTRNPKEACVYLVLVGEALKDGDDVSENENVNKPALDFRALKRLPYWGGDGRNHVLLNLARRDLSTNAGDIFSTINTGS